MHLFVKHEALRSPESTAIGELTVVVDHNKMRSDYSVQRTSASVTLAKFAAFGSQLERIDGYDTEAGILKEHDAGQSTAEICRKSSVSGTTFYKWRVSSAGWRFPSPAS